MIASNAITNKLNEVSKIAESLDTALRETQTYLEMDSARTNSLDRKMADGNASVDSRGSIDVSIVPLFFISFLFVMITKLKNNA